MRSSERKKLSERLHCCLNVDIGYQGISTQHKIFWPSVGWPGNNPQKPSPLDEGAFTMSVTSGSFATMLKIVLEQTPNSIIFKKPVRTFVDRDDVTHFASSHKVSALFKDFEHGLPVAYGKLGAAAYAEPPFKLKDKVGGLDVYGWKPGAKRNENVKKCYAIVLGAKKYLDREYVYYTPSQDVTSNKHINVRKHFPSPVRTRVYVASIKTFLRYLNEIYPAKKNVSEFDRKSVIIISTASSFSRLSSWEKKYAEKWLPLSP